ncbi:MAG: hypothetical protein AB7O98_05580 [Hyphomonadaceae bacterium]
MTLVARHLGALWRPLPAAPTGTADEVFAAACDGAIPELEQLATSLPQQVHPEAVRGLRTTRGLALVPGSDPGQMFLFPSPELRSIAGGLGSFTVVDAGQGRIDLVDAAGTTIQTQLGQAGGRSVLRILSEGQPPQSFVGCAPTVD